jgi:hypothetical protein
MYVQLTGKPQQSSSIASKLKDRDGVCTIQRKDKNEDSKILIEKTRLTLRRKKRINTSDANLGVQRRIQEVIVWIGLTEGVACEQSSGSRTFSRVAG